MNPTDRQTSLSPAYESLFDLRHHVVWITGASRGIGASISTYLAGAGVNLVLQARSGEELEAVASTCRLAGSEVETVVGSVTDEQSADAAVAVATQRWGRLDGLVNNAGISPVLQRAESISVSQWREICDVNLNGAFIAASRAGRAMLAQGRGSIVNISSVHGQVAGERLSAYSASKGGLDMLTRTLAVEWAERVLRVNAVAPSYVATTMTAELLSHEHWSKRLLAKVPMGRFADAAELSGAVHFLLARASSYITGVVLNVDGGWSAQ